MKIIGGGDTIDTRMIIVLWNTLRDSKTEISLRSDNIRGLQTTCNYVERPCKGEMTACPNYVGVTEDLCSIHYAIRGGAENKKFEKCIFPLVFGNYTCYVEAVYEDYLIGKKPFTFQTSRELATILYRKALGKLIIFSKK